MVVFEERGNRSTWRKPLGAEKRNNKLNPHLTPDLGIEPGPHWWEASALTTSPTLHPRKQEYPKRTLKIRLRFTETQCTCNGAGRSGWWSLHQPDSPRSMVESFFFSQMVTYPVINPDQQGFNCDLWSVTSDKGTIIHHALAFISVANCTQRHNWQKVRWLQAYTTHVVWPSPYKSTQPFITFPVAWI